MPLSVKGKEHTIWYMTAVYRFSKYYDAILKASHSFNVQFSYSREPLLKFRLGRIGGDIRRPHPGDRCTVVIGPVIPGFGNAEGKRWRMQVPLKLVPGLGGRCAFGSPIVVVELDASPILEWTVVRGGGAVRCAAVRQRENYIGVEGKYLTLRRKVDVHRTSSSFLPAVVVGPA